MSLPPGFIDDLRSRIPISRVIGRKVVWDLRKSNQGRGDWWAPCPFHQEKSASFHCDDQKGFYYCFGCHAKGDALTFLRETEGLDFIEAVKVLAAEAGVAIPEPDPLAQQSADLRSQLLEINEAAGRWFKLQLQTAQAASARDYLTHRGLTDDVLEQFGIGFAPDNRSALTEGLRAKGFAEDLIEKAGISARPDDGGPAYDRFRGRIIFPIRDVRGRLIGFGGRAMDPNARAKYLNSPETPLFDKGRQLYNLGPARAAVAKGQPLIVVEGYMDVIAMSCAGFASVVAPLGTAITEDQLRLMWRVSPEPVIALDGDSAGQRAARRVLDLALPMTGPGQALRFVTLPEGQDPDDLLKSAGPGAMSALLNGSRPLIDLLWQRETEQQDFSSPERKARLERRLKDAIGKIPDEATRRHYDQDLRRRQYEAFGRTFTPKKRDTGQAQRRGGVAGGSFAAPPTFTAVPPLPDAGADSPYAFWEGVCLLICATRRDVLGQIESRLERLLPRDGDRAALLHDLLTGASSKEGDRALETLKSSAHFSCAPPKIDQQRPEDILALLGNLLDRMEAQRAADAELARAVAEIQGEADEGMTWRLSQTTQARHRAERPELQELNDLDDNRDDAAYLDQFVTEKKWRKQPGK